MSQLLDHIACSAHAHPETVALASMDRKVRFGEMPLLAAVAANQLNFADPGGGSVAILLPDCVDWMIAHPGALQLGRTTVMATPDLAPDELLRCLPALGVTSAITPFGLVAIDATFNGGSEAYAMTLIRSDGPAGLAVERFTEAMILSPHDAPRPAVTDWSPSTEDIRLPAAIVDFYDHAVRRISCSLRPWLSPKVAIEWAETLMQPRCALTAH